MICIVYRSDAFFLIALHFGFYLQTTYTFYLEKFLMDSKNNEQRTKNASNLPASWKWKRGKMPKILTSVFHNMHQSQEPIHFSAMTHDPRAGCWSESVLFQNCSEPEQCRRWNQFCVWDRWAIDTAHPSEPSNIENYSNLHRFEFWLKIPRVVESACSAWSPSPSVSVQRRTRYFILYLMWGFKQFSPPSHQRFCLDSLLARHGWYTHWTCPSCNKLGQLEDHNSFWGQF